jgi:hypothetical protein
MNQQQKHKTVPLTTKATDTRTLDPQLEKATYQRHSTLNPNGKIIKSALVEIMRNGTRTRSPKNWGPKSPPLNSDEAPEDENKVSEAARVEPSRRRTRSESTDMVSDGNAAQAAELASTYQEVQPTDSSACVHDDPSGGHNKEASFGNIDPDDRVRHFTRSKNPTSNEKELHHSGKNIVSNSAWRGCTETRGMRVALSLP